MATWIEEAYELGQKGWPASFSQETRRRILSDPAPSNWVKWWRRGLLDAEKVARCQL